MAELQEISSKRKRSNSLEDHFPILHHPNIEKNPTVKLSDNVENIENLIKKDENTGNFKLIIEEIILLAFPAVINAILDAIGDVFYYHFASELVDPVYVGSIGLGIFFINVTQYTIKLGFLSALATYGSQAIGKKDQRLAGIQHLRARIVISLISIPLALLQFFAKQIFNAVGINERLATLAGEFCSHMVISILIQVHVFILARFMLVQNIIASVTIINFISLLLGILSARLFIFTFKLDHIGVAQAKTFQSIANFVILHGQVHQSKCLKDTWFWFNEDSLKEWKPFFLLGLYGAFMVGFEFWAFEFIQFFASFLGTQEMAANVALFNMINVLYSIPTGLGQACTTLVGNCIGAAEVILAKKKAIQTLILNGGTMICLNFLCWTMREQIANWFSKDEAVISLISGLIQFLCIVEVMDSNNGILNSILIALSKQKPASVGNFISYYCIMLPFVWILAFKLNYRLGGLWCAIFVGILCQNAFNIYFNLKDDWKKISDEAILAMENESSNLAVVH